MITVYMFTGYQMNPKRYKSYFSLFNNDIIYNPDEVKAGTETIILTHSLGLIKSLIWCNKYKIIPKIIIAFDPDSILESDINNKISTLTDPELKYTYISYLNSDIDITKYNIHLIRQNEKANYQDTCFYQSHKYYSEPTHHPYMLRTILLYMKHLISTTTPKHNSVSFSVFDPNFNSVSNSVSDPNSVSVSNSVSNSVSVSDPNSI